METITIQIDDDNEVEVPKDKFDSVVQEQGYLSPDNVKESYVKKSYFESELNDRIGRAKNKTREELKADEEFLKAAAQEHGLDLEELKKKKDIDLDAMKASWEEENLKPIKNKFESLLSRAKQSDIIQAAANSGIKDAFIKDVSGNIPIVNMFSGSFEYDPETQTTYVKGQDGNFVQSNNPSNDKPYKTASEFFEELRGNESYAEYFKNEKQGGSGYSGGGKKGATTKKRSEMSDTEKMAYIKENGREAYEKLPLK